MNTSQTHSAPDEHVTNTRTQRHKEDLHSTQSYPSGLSIHIALSPPKLRKMFSIQCISSAGVGCTESTDHDYSQEHNRGATGQTGKEDNFG